MLELIHKLIKTCKLATKWLKPITKVLNELIGLNEYDYYSKVLKTIIISLKPLIGLNEYDYYPINHYN